MSVLSRMSMVTAIVATIVLALGGSVDGELMESNAQQHSRQLNWYYYWNRGNSYSYGYRSSGYKYGLCNYWWSKWLKCCQIINDESSSESSSEEDPVKDFYTKRLNCGCDGEEDFDGSYYYIDTHGNKWISDSGYSNSDEIEYGGDDLEIEYTDDDEIYRSSRFLRGDKDLVYTFDDVYDGVYEIKLRFAEIFFDSVGDRTFDIYINDELKEYDVDILAEVDKNTAYKIKFYNVQVYDGLEIRFGRGANDPKVSGIEILQVDFH